MGFHKPLIRPAISGGVTWPGGGRLTSHDITTPNSFVRSRCCRCSCHPDCRFKRPGTSDECCQDFSTLIEVCKSGWVGFFIVLEHFCPWKFEDSACGKL